MKYIFWNKEISQCCVEAFRYWDGEKKYGCGACGKIWKVGAAE